MTERRLWRRERVAHCPLSEQAPQEENRPVPGRLTHDPLTELGIGLLQV